jgi:predicted dehydrogenase
MKTDAAHPSPAAPLRSRRNFLKTSAVAWAAIQFVPGRLFGANSQPSLAGIGIGGVGHSQLQGCAQAGFQINALCDVDDNFAKKTFDRYPQARRYRDFRELLQAEGDKIDAVYCGTPDHTHALITLAALRRKKHVCCVKPLTRTIHESRLVVAEARRAGVATQVTASPNTTDGACRTCELIAAGALGPVREVHIWSNRPIWPQGMERPAGQDIIPASFDWKLWLGPAPERPFRQSWPEGHPALTQMNMAGKPPSRSVYHPFNFRGWWDFGTGALGDMGCHYFNTPFRALQLASPVRVSATATKVLAESAPLAALVTYEFPARGQMPPVRLIWYDGGLKPPYPAEMDGEPLPPEGTLYIGDQGKMLGHQILDEARAAKFKDLPRTLPRRGGTWVEWFQAVQGGEPAGCHFDGAGPLAEAVQLGNIAIRRGKRLEWDTARRKFTNDPAANQYVEEPCHNGWSLDQA